MGEMEIDLLPEATPVKEVISAPAAPQQNQKG
jgi:hypothetical protein